ncbi:hypothetical protein SU48_06585 [Deinococcus puniceus]|uniref:Uncharacterized protein n=2 Tax=Deinococcus puniceus TaxID=1182568 RepID=A0A172T8Y9_9DEIO|nr:hypothetical protein SU48_06585 [Deinococcus puniceus]
MALAFAASASSPQATVTFPGMAAQVVRGQANTAQNAEYPWTLRQTLYAPTQQAAAVRFCWNAVKYTGCETKLAWAAQPVLTLPKGDVSQLLWTTDGKYLIGAGANTLRLWNLVGGVRTAATPVVGSVVQRLWLAQSRSGKADLCVSVGRMLPVNGVYRTTMTTLRYALPTLKVLTVTTLPHIPSQQKAKEAECRPLSSSDLN